jgi:hypothetical protein
MGKRFVVLAVVVAVCAGLSAPTRGATQADYTGPAIEAFAGNPTLEGMVEAYQTLNNGMNNPAVTGDKRQLILLHVVARTAMLGLDTGNVSVNTSLLEVVQPLGITMTGHKFFSDIPDDPDMIKLVLPRNPADPNCLQFPPGADVNAAASAINTHILPQLEQILTELNQVTNTPAFSMILTPAQTGLESNVEVDWGDVLALKAALLSVKTVLYAVANPGYDFVVDLSNPIFTGWQCDSLPDTTTANTILNAYPNLLKILPGVGSGRLSQAKTNLVAALNAVDAALTSITSETDAQTDDLLQLDKTDRVFVAFRAEFNKLRTSLSNSTAATYTLGSKQTFTLKQSTQTIGQLGLEYGGPMGVEGEGGWIRVTNPGDLPGWWDIGWFRVDGTSIEGDAEGWNENGNWWASFWGTISSDGGQITNMTFEYSGWWSGDTVTGLSAQRTTNELLTVQFNPNPLFAGSVAPRNMLPQFDSEGEAVPGTMGHGLNNDATLGGVFPGMTQSDWLSRGFEVWGGNTDLRNQPGNWHLLYNIDQQGYTKLGESGGSTRTFSGNYQYYVIAARGRFLLDSIQGSNGTFYNGSLTTGNTESWENIDGATDSLYATVGEDRFLDLGGDSFSGYVAIANPGGWTGLTVITDTAPSTLHDWNDDGIVSIIGDVPPFVQCVYFSNCPPGASAIGDCNGDGIISIVGDVPCFVQCVYFGDCP